MLRSPIPSISTQPAYIARGCVNSQFTLSRANVVETPCKSVNRCRKSLVYNELYLQTGFTAGWCSWVGLQWYLTQLQGRQEVGWNPTQNSPRPLPESVNRGAYFELPAIVSPYVKSRLRYRPPTQAIYRPIYRPIYRKLRLIRPFFQLPDAIRLEFCLKEHGSQSNILPQAHTVRRGNG